MYMPVYWTPVRHLIKWTMESYLPYCWIDKCLLFFYVWFLTATWDNTWLLNGGTIAYRHDSVSLMEWNKVAFSRLYCLLYTLTKLYLDWKIVVLDALSVANSLVQIHWWQIHWWQIHWWQIHWHPAGICFGATTLYDLHKWPTRNHSIQYSSVRWRYKNIQTNNKWQWPPYTTRRPKCTDRME